MGPDYIYVYAEYTRDLLSELWLRKLGSPLDYCDGIRYSFISLISTSTLKGRR